MVRNESTRKPGRGRTRRRQSEAQLIQSANLASLEVMAEEIGHEIRSLLTVCSSAAQFILEDNLDPEFRRLCLEKILSGITRASAIIETLLRYTRAPEKVEVSSLDMGRVIHDPPIADSRAKMIKENWQEADC